MNSFDYPMLALIGLGAIMALFLYALLVVAWRILHDEGRLRLHHMLRRHGIDPERAAGMQSYDTAVATRRCVACSDKEACDAWFASFSSGDIRKFCPNAGFVRRMAERN